MRLALACVLALTFGRGTVITAAGSLLRIRESGGRVTPKQDCKLMTGGPAVFAAAGVLLLAGIPGHDYARAAFAEAVTLLKEKPGLPFPAFETIRGNGAAACGPEMFFMLGSQESARARFQRGWVAIEAGAHSADVAGRWQIVRIGRRGPEWLERPGVCQP
jgi:hypothetical protein